MGESRNDLLAWINDLTQLGYTKIEQCGSGAVQCVIMDSVYRDVPLSKVKFNAKHEYEYVANFKVLQSCFDKHNIENAIPVTRLIKCKFQDNLEFLQWIKKYWDQFYPGGSYDAISRRKASDSLSGSRSSLSLEQKKPVKSAKVRGSSMVTAPTGAKPSKNDLESEYQKIIDELTSQVSELNGTLEQVTKEREFYFNKLREIEIFVQSSMDEADENTDSNLKTVQDILYKTEDGFEIPETDEIPVSAAAPVVPMAAAH